MLLLADVEWLRCLSQLMLLVVVCLLATSRIRGQHGTPAITETGDSWHPACYEEAEDGLERYMELLYTEMLLVVL